MIPIKDDNPTIHAPIVTVVLIVLNVLVYFGWQTRGNRLEEALRNFQYATVPANVTRAASEPEAAAVVLTQRTRTQELVVTDLKYAEIPDGREVKAPQGTEIYFQKIKPWQTLLLSMFMHGSIMHLLGNMMFLWIFGNNIEDATGRIRFLIFYVGTGLAASAGHILSEPGSLIPSLGASGAISGVLGGYLLLYPKARILTLIPLPFLYTTMYLPAFAFLGIWLVMQFSGVLQAGAGVAWWAHIGGFIAGVALIKLLESREHRQRGRVQVITPQNDVWRSRM